MTDIFDHNNNDINSNSNQGSNNHIPFIKNQSFVQSQGLYNNNNPKTSYNPNEYLKMGQNNKQQIYNQDSDDNQKNIIKEKIQNINNINQRNLINDKNKMLNNIGSIYGNINDEKLMN